MRLRHMRALEVFGTDNGDGTGDNNCDANGDGSGDGRSDANETKRRRTK